VRDRHGWRGRARSPACRDNQASHRGRDAVAAGQGQVVDELIMRFTHSIRMDWLLPGIPPTGKRVEVPFVAIGGSLASAFLIRGSQFQSLLLHERREPVEVL
jgi:hypothetical protein